MKKLLQKDLGLIFLLAIISTVLALFPPKYLNLTNYLNIILFLIIFFCSGYSLLSLIYPEEDYKGLLRKPVLILELSVILAISVSLVLAYSSIGLQLKFLIVILSLITMVILVAANIRVIKAFRKHLKPEFKEKTLDEFAKKTITPSKPSIWSKIPKDLILITSLSIILLISILVPPINKTPSWMVPGSLFIFFIPGYVLISVLFPKKEYLGKTERFALSCGLSLLLTPIIGLILNYTPLGIRIESILTILAVITLLTTLIDFSRLSKLNIDDRSHIPKLNKILLIFLVISVVLTAMTTSIVIINSQPTENKTNNTNWTDFSVTTLNVKAVDNTINLTSGQRVNLTIKVTNHENSNINYQLLVKVNNTTLKTENISLENNKTIEIPYNFTAGLPGNRKIEFILYKAPNESPYQKREFFMNIA